MKRPFRRPDPAGHRGRRRARPLLDADEVELTPRGRLERAVARFNDSDAGRTVARLSRSLGAPSVSLGSASGGAGTVRVTVAWEYSWYQWIVDLGDEGGEIAPLGKGQRVAELDSAARQWNASTDAGGRLVLVAPRRRVQRAPVRR